MLLLKLKIVKCDRSYNQLSFLDPLLSRSLLYSAKTFSKSRFDQAIEYLRDKFCTQVSQSNWDAFEVIV